MDQLRAKRDEQEREAERNRQAEQQERLIQAQAEQQERMIQMLAEARRPPPVTEPTLCTPRLTLHNSRKGSTIWVPFLTPSRQQPELEDGHGSSGQSSYEARYLEPAS